MRRAGSRLVVSAALSGAAVAAQPPAAGGRPFGDRPATAADCLGDTAPLVGRTLAQALTDVRSRAPQLRLRVVRVGDQMTMDMDEHRLTILVDAKGMVSRIYCG